MNRISYLDGFRGVAVLLVVLFHLGVINSGFSGVELFFVISGFIITLLILKEYTETESLNIKQFFIRRISRIYPSLLVTILGTLFLFINFPVYSIYEKVTSQGVFSALGVENFYELFHSLGYWERGVKSPLLHMWSIGIELQFYLFWPFIMKYLLKSQLNEPKGKEKVQQWLLAMAVILGIGTVFASSYLSFNQMYYNPLTRIFSFVIGGMVGVVLFNAEKKKLKGQSLMISGLILSLSYLSWAYFDVGNLLLFKGVIIIFSGLFASLIYLAGVTETRIINYVFENPVLLFIGKISFSLYLVHMPVIFFLSSDAILKLTGVSLHSQNYVLQLLQFCFSIISALVLHYLVESKVKLRGGVPCLILVMTLPLITSVMVKNANDFRLFKGSEQLIEQRWIASEPIVIEGQENVLFVGDSWSRRTAMGFALANQKNSQVDYGTLAYGVGNGSLMDPHYYLQNNEKIGMYKSFSGYLEHWETALNTYYPTKVILEFGNSDQAKMVIDEEEIQVGDPGFAALYISQYQKVIDFFSRREVDIYVMNVINNAHQRSELALTKQSDEMNLIIKKVLKNNANKVQFLDIQGLLADGSSQLSPPMIKGISMYDETWHNSYDGAIYIGDWLIQELQQK